MSVKVGILGLAHGHVTSYLSKWRENPQWGVQATAAWDHDGTRLEKAATDFGLHAYDDVDALLNDSGVDAVAIGAETAYHSGLVCAAAQAKKAIILQKPMALTIAEADKMVDAVSEAKVPFTMAWQMRVDPQNVWIKQMLESGQLGKVFHVRRRHGLGTNHWPGFVDTWHVQPAMNRDIWADDAAHPIDFINWLMGIPESVVADMTTMADERIPNDNGIALFRYADGLIAEVSCSFTCAAAENTVEIYAQNGSIIQNYGDATSCNVPRPEGAVGLKWYSTNTRVWEDSGIPSPGGHGERIAGLAQPLAEFLQGQRGPIATAEEGRMSLRMLLACYVSAREGRRVFLSEPSIVKV